jgi:predicted dehydrogenase
MIKIGIIGLGFMGRMHASAYRQLAAVLDFKVTAVADEDEEQADKMAEMFGAKAYYSPHDMIEHADINTVDICVPTWLHYLFAAQAIEKGFHVFIEKPLCPRSKDAFALARQAKEKQVFAQVGQCLRFWTEYEYLKSLVDDGIYGKMEYLKLRRLSPRPGWGAGNWMMDDWKSGGAALDLQIHDADFALYLFGKPEKIKAFVQHGCCSYSGIVSELKYKDLTVMTEGSWDYPSSFPFEMSYLASFEKATVLFSSIYGLKVCPVEGESFVPALKKACAVQSEAGGNISDLGGYYNELYYFIDCINKGLQPVKASLTAGAEAVELVEKQIRAAEDK